MKTIILCGGKGTRMSELTSSIPKPMAEIGGQPVLVHIMQRYAHYGFKEFILPLGYKGNIIKDYFCNFYRRNSSIKVDLGTGETNILSNKSVDWKVWMVDVGVETLKGARIKRVGDLIDSENFMVTYGDGVADVDIRKLVDFHCSHGKIATFTGVRMPSRFGTVRTDMDGNVSSWEEKPILDSYINSGFFVFKKDFLDFLSSDENCDLEQEPLKQLAAMGELMMYKHEGFWKCMDTPRDNQELNKLYAENKTPWLKY